MFKKVEEKRGDKAQNFIIKAKEEFKKFIPRDTIGNVGVTECIEKDGAFAITGSVDTVSPTGKKKIFKYSAIVNVDANGNSSLLKLQVDEI